MRPANRRFTLCLIGAALGWSCNCGPQPTPDGGEPPAPPPLELGETTDVLTTTLGTSGANVTVGDGVLAGLRVDVPAGAWPSDVPLTIRVTPVTQVRLDGVRAGSPLISLDVAAGFASRTLTVFIPGPQGDGEFPMVFGYDRATGRFEGMPSYPADGGTVFLTRHLSEYLTLLTQDAKLDEPVATPFQFGVDDFALSNTGSYVAPHGFCSGQVVSALHYFQTRRDGGAPLVEVGDGRPPGTASTRTSQAFFWDDTRAFQLVSAVQRDSVFSFANGDVWRELQQHRNPALTHRLFSAALHVTKLPQYLGVDRYFPDGGVAGGHALLVFAKQQIDGGARYLLSDPNYPWRADASVPRFAEYRAAGDGGFVPYQGRLNVNDPEREYTTFGYFGTWAYVPKDTVEGHWAAFERSQLGDVLPEVSLVATGSTIAGNPETALVDGLVRTDPLLRVKPNPEPFVWRLSTVDTGFAVVDQSTRTLGRPVEYPLGSGDNLVGVIVEGRDGTTVPNFAFVDFRWVRVRSEAPVAGAPTLLGSASFTSGAKGIDVVGTTAYVMLDAQGLAIVDVSSPSAPVTQVVANVSPHSTGRGVVVSADQYAFAGVGSFKVIDVRDPRAPTVMGAAGFNADCGRLVTRGDWAFVACGSKSYVSEGFMGIATIAQPGDAGVSRAVSGITWSMTVKDVELSADGNTAFLLGSGGTLAAFDVTTPRQPGATAKSTLGSPGTATSFALDREGSRLFVAAGRLDVVDVSDPNALRRLGSDPYRDVRDVDVVGSTAVAVGFGNTQGRLWVYDVSNPGALTVPHYVDLPGTGTAVKLIGNRAYVTVSLSGGGGQLLIFGL